MSDNNDAPQPTEQSETLDDAQLEQVAGGTIGGTIFFPIPPLTTFPIETDPIIFNLPC